MALLTRMPTGRPLKFSLFDRHGLLVPVVIRYFLVLYNTQEILSHCPSSSYRLFFHIHEHDATFQFMDRLHHCTDNDTTKWHFNKRSVAIQDGTFRIETEFATNVVGYSPSFVQYSGQRKSKGRGCRNFYFGREAFHHSSQSKKQPNLGIVSDPCCQHTQSIRRNNL